MEFGFGCETEVEFKSKLSVKAKPSWNLRPI